MILEVVGGVSVGVVAGFYAARTVGQESYTGRGPGGDLIFAVVGSIVGGLIARFLSLAGAVTGDAFVWPSLIFAALGAIVALSLARATSDQEARR